MKTGLKKVTLLIATGLISSASFAQLQNEPSIEGTKPFSPSSDYRVWSFGVNAGVLNQSNLFGFNRAGFDKLQSNFGYSAYIKRQISPSFGLKAQYLGGKVGGKNENALPGEIQEFEAKLPWSAAISGEFTLANTNWRFVNSIVKPYISLGLGVLNNKTSVDVSPSNLSPAVEIAEKSTTKLYVPLDFGFKFAVAKGINIDLGYQLSWANQHLDGKPAGQYKNDLFSYGHAGVEFALGNREKPFLANSNPVATMELQYDALKAENDALKAANKNLQQQVSEIHSDLRDDDGDGVANKFDKCPDTPKGTQVDGAGCPIIVVNETKVIEKIIITEEDKQVVAEAIKNLEFDLSKATIRPSSYPSLDRVATLLIEKNINLKLAGYTDNTGSLQLNMRLSKERAEAVKHYLVSKGANPANIEAAGYGPNDPIATNATPEGRQLNRRVEFILY